MNERFDRAMEEFDAANRRDPRRLSVQGTRHPREMIFSRRVQDWVERLDADASEGVRLAARAHTLRRWEIPRERYPRDTPGYHAWRKATAAHSARAAGEILGRLGYPPETVDRVRRLITGELFPSDPDAQLLEDADVLVFLEIKLSDYLGQWKEAKTARILQGTWAKMSPRARRAARDLSLDAGIRALIARLPED